MCWLGFLVELVVFRVCHLSDVEFFFIFYFYFNSRPCITVHFYFNLRQCVFDSHLWCLTSLDNPCIIFIFILTHVNDVFDSHLWRVWSPLTTLAIYDVFDFPWQPLHSQIKSTLQNWLFKLKIYSSFLFINMILAFKHEIKLRDLTNHSP